MANEGGQTYLETIHSLLADKDRLLAEKDQIIQSRDELWKEMHVRIKEKDLQIKKLLNELSARQNVAEASTVAGLQQQVQHLESRNQDLERAQQAFGNKVLVGPYDEVEGDSMERELREALEEGRSGSGYLESENATTARTKTEEHDFKGLQAAPRYLSLSLSAWSSLTNVFRPHDTLIPAYSYSDPKQQLSDPTAPSTLLPARARQTAPQSIVDCMPKGHSFYPLIEVGDEDTCDCGELSKTAIEVQISINSIFSGINQKSPEDTSEGRRNRLPSKNREARTCLSLFVQSTQSHWTEQSPRRYTCRTCFNARRACILWLGHKKWIVLPTPPQTRDPQITWRDAAFYIHRGTETNTSFSDVWLKDKKNKKSKREVAAMTGDGPELGSREDQQMAEYFAEEVSEAE